MTAALPVLPVALPMLVAAVLTGLGPFLRRRAADLVAVLAAAAATGCSAVLLVRSVGGPEVYWFGGWTPRPGGIALGVDFAVDQAAAALAVLAGLLTTGALLFSWRYFEAVGTLFHALMLVFLAGLTGFALSGDIFNMFVFFELMSVAAYALTGYQTEERGAIQGALNFAVTNSLGAILVLFGIALLYGRTGALNLAQMGQTLAAAAPADRVVVIAFALLVAGFFVKAAIVPFHFWLADAYAVAPTPVCVLFAGIMSELGLYAVARLYWTVFAPDLGPRAGQVRAVLLAVGALTTLLGAVMCLPQRQLARLLAFATVSHVGVMLLGVALLDGPGAGAEAGAPVAAGLAGSLLYVVADGLVKAGLFVAVGVLAQRFGTVDLGRLTGAGRHMPRTAALMLVGAAALAGLPPFGTWLGKALIDEAAVAAGHGWIPWVVFVSAALTGGAVARAAVRVFFTRPAADAAGPAPDRRPARPPRPPLVMWLPGAVFLLAALAVGVSPGAAGRAGQAAVAFTDTAGYAATVLRGAPPVAPPPQPGAAHLGAGALTGLAATALAALIGLTARRGAAAGWWRRSADRLGAAFRGPVEALRAIHSGEVGDSVTWFTVGAAGLAAVFSLLLR
jgi:multicomponent Na+:H+ antiporter subunit D